MSLTSPCTAPSLQNRDPNARAEKHNEEGDRLFKAENFTKAIQMYSDAASVEPSTGVYSSNLSAALFEIGAYARAIAAISRSYYAIQTSPKEKPDTLLRELSTRLARTLCDGFHGGHLTSHILQTHADLINSLKNISNDDKASLDNEVRRSWWAKWNSMVIDESAGHLNRRQLSRVALSALPLRKQAVDPLLEYSSVGQDGFHSILEKVSPDDNHVRLQEIRERSENLSFLFGGAGDARYAFCSLIDVYLQCSKDTTLDVKKLHLTLVDTHPRVLARDLVLLMLLQKTTGPISLVEETKLYSTLYYVYSGVVMPSYAHDILMQTCEDIKQRLSSPQPNLPSSIALDPSLVQPIKDCMDYWSNLRTTTSLLLNHVNVQVPHDGLDTCLAREAALYSTLKVLLPPEFGDEARHFSPAYDRVQSGNKLWGQSLSTTVRHIKSTWKPNPTLFDEAATFRDSYHPTGFHPKFANFDPVRLVKTMLPMQKRLRDDLTSRPPYDRTPSFGYFDIAIRRVSRALSAMENKVKFELVAGDVMQYLAITKLDAHPGDWRQGLPSTFTRMWMGNSLEYTGSLLELALFAVPCVRNFPEATVGMKCVYNGPAGDDFADFVYTNTLTTPSKLPQFLGCDIKCSLQAEGQQPFALVPSSSPLPPDHLAPRKELQRWLHRVLIHILSPPRPISKPEHKVSNPTTLRTFIQLLMHVKQLGYPSHWVSEVLEKIVQDNLESEHRPSQDVPIPASEIMSIHPRRKMQLSPWMADIEVVVATVLPALPFALRLPQGFPAASDIGLYTSPIDSIRGADGSEEWGSPRSPSLALLFVAKGVRAEESHIRSKSVLFSHSSIGDKMQLMLSIDRLEVDSWNLLGKVSWRMGDERVEKMKSEGWHMCLWRTDRSIPVSDLTSASQWSRARTIV